MKNSVQIKLFLGLLSIVILFHVSILVKIIPYNAVWGGRLETEQEMYLFEIVSVLINIFLGFILLIKATFIKPFLSSKVILLSLWIFLILFVLNTIGNLFAKTWFEKMFAILTFLFSFLIWNILKFADKKIQ